MQDHRKLRVWKKSFQLALSVRRGVDRYPRRGYASLKEQTCGAAESVPFNIVEGCGSPTQRVFARFLGVSIRSSRELEGELEFANACGALPDKDWAYLGTETIDTRRMLYRLRSKVLAAALEEEQTPHPQRQTVNPKPSRDQSKKRSSEGG